MIRRIRNETGAWLLMARTARLYRTFVLSGQLAFDIGAHTGLRTRALLKATPTVVAVEPQPRYAMQINRRAVVEQVAVGSAPGTATLYLAPDAPELATLSQQWVDTIRERFPDKPYSEQIRVEVTTLDALIAKHGFPEFCKIDTEGYDAEVIAGLSTPIKALAFEVASEARHVPLQAIDLLGQLGDYEFAYSRGDSMSLGPWMNASETRTFIGTLPPLAQGDLYAHLAHRRLR